MIRPENSVLMGDFPELDRIQMDLEKCAITATRFGADRQFETLYILAACRRTFSLMVSFRHSLVVGNEQMAATILRLNLDTVARFYALFWADETEGLGAEKFAQNVTNGHSIRNMKLRQNGLPEKKKKPANDRWLIEQIEKLEPWIHDVYKQTSGAIHFSDFHIERTLQQSEGSTQEADGVRYKILLGGTEKIRSPGQYNILRQAFAHICLLLLCAMQDRCGLLDRSTPLAPSTD